jgi:hypothetical protein
MGDPLYFFLAKILLGRTMQADRGAVAQLPQSDVDTGRTPRVRCTSKVCLRHLRLPLMENDL